MNVQSVMMGFTSHLTYTHEYNDKLDFGGDSCNNEKGYSRDLCTNKAIEIESLNTFGCTSPFGSNKDKICTQDDEDGNITKLYNEAMHGSKAYGECLNPCSFFKMIPTKFGLERNADFSTVVWIYFEEIINVTKGYHLYSGLSLIAEIGGYVGLFLGVSVNHITSLMEYLALKFEKM